MCAVDDIETTPISEHIASYVYSARSHCSSSTSVIRGKKRCHYTIQEKHCNAGYLSSRSYTYTRILFSNKMMGTFFVVVVYSIVLLLV